MNIPNAKIAQLHACYERLTGIQLPLNRAFQREYAWSAWMAHGWTVDDLSTTILYLRREFKDYWLKMVRFSRLVEDHASFEEWLSIARASQRNARPAPTERQRVLTASGRPQEPPKDKVVTPKDVLATGYADLWKAVEG